MKKGLLIGISVAAIAVIGIMISAGVFKQKIKKDIAHTPWAVSAMSNPSGTIMLVEFVDYACPYCDQFSPILDEAVKDDPTLNILIRPVALLGDESEQIASLIIAAADFNHALTLHRAVINRMEAPSVAITLDEAKKLGIDINELQKIAASDKVNKTLRINKAVHKALGFKGIPALLINNTPYKLSDGMPNAARLKQIIKERQ
jgi:protein-disulfide isomerase